MSTITELSHIQLRGAKEHNLKNIDVDIPKKSLVVITGVSGSGKSSLAFDTLCAEGQRRYVESLSSYARQFLGQSEKPKYETIKGLSPTISIDQKSASKNPRSTVGTITEIYDYLRLLYARVGVQHCIKCQKPIGQGDPQSMLEQLIQLPPQTKVILLAPLISNRKGEYKDLLLQMKAEGFSRLRIDGIIQKIEDIASLSKNQKHNIDVVIDRFVIKNDSNSRKKYLDSLELALKFGQGNIIIHIENREDIVMSQNRSCCNLAYPELSPQLFSFNSPIGSCPECHGIGDFHQVDIAKVVVAPDMSIDGGAIAPWNTFFDAQNTFDINTKIAWNSIPKEKRNIFLYGDNKKHEGLIPKLNRLYSYAQKENKDSWVAKYVSPIRCHVCKGERLAPMQLNVKVDEYTISDLTSFSITDLLKNLNNLKLKGNKKIIGQEVLKELLSRIQFLQSVGLGYLSLNRSGPTLSGGEAQRIRLASQIGSELTGVLYVLDEPSIGLHQRDNQKLINTLKHLRDLGNTVLVVEHDEETMIESDWILDIGPGAGHLGGNVVAQGIPKTIINHPQSLTGQYLSGKKSIELPKERRKIPKDNTNKISILNAQGNNIKNIDVDFPLQVLTCVTGVSGAGKSTLINQILTPALHNYLNPNSYRETGTYKKIIGMENIDKLIDIDQKPIGRTPRSNPATYTKVFDHIRDLFFQLPESKARGFTKGRFSFNVDGGRCAHCQGDGILTIEMHFLADISIPCEVCNGKRFNPQTLEIKYKGHSISDVLDLSVAENLELFSAHPKIIKILETLVSVGLGYIKLGQCATTLSGGEAQRIKLSKELAKRQTGKTLYILDEPTTGLHFEDINRLIHILQTLVDRGNSIIVIEHNLDVIKCADYLIDLGPEGGVGGGQIVAQGTPEEVSKNKNSITGKFLKDKLR